MFLPLHYQNRKVAQLVAHYVRDVGVGRSSRLFPTEVKERIFYILSFFVQNLISEMSPLSDRNALTLLCKHPIQAVLYKNKISQSPDRLTLAYFVFIQYGLYGMLTVHYCSDKMTEGIDHEVKPLFGT